MEATYAEAIGRATVEAMEADPSIIVLGSGATDFKGIFGTTLEATKRFPDRVWDVPNSEAALGGIVCGLATQGKHPLWIHHRVDFLTYCFDPIVNLLAKWSTMYQTEPLPVTIRTLVGRGWGQGPTHSQFLGSTFAHFPGLTVVAPEDAPAAHDELRNALATPTPHLLVEHRALYQDQVRWGGAQMLGTGPSAVTIVSCSVGMREASHAARILWDQHDIRAHVVPIRRLRPFFPGLILESLQRTHRLVVLDPGWTAYGFGAEVLACAAESGLLKAPAVRIAPPPVPAPTSSPLEAAYWPGADAVVQAVLRMLGHEAAVPGEPQPDGFTGPY